MDINESYNRIMDYLQKNIKDSKEFSKSNNEISKLMLELMMNVNNKSSELEKRVSRIEQELYIDDFEEDYGMEVVCPYCNCEFETEVDDLKTELICPECNNVIELDWNEEIEQCNGSCSSCGGNCMHNEEDEDEDM